MAKVICPGCKQSYHETTDQFDPDITPHGAMFMYTGQKTFWHFRESKNTPPGELECPGCGVLYTKGVKFIAQLEDVQNQTPKKGSDNKIPNNLNATLVAMFKNGHKPGEIGAAIGGFSRQAVDRRLRDLNIK